MPDIFRVKIEGSNSNLFVASTTLEATKSEILSGRYIDLGLSISEQGQLVVIGEVYPVAEKGRYSKRNRDGYFTTRKDLPKISKTFYCGERPIFGDYSKGTFSLNVTKLVYQKDFTPPADLTMSLELIKTYPSNNEENYVFKLSVNNILDKRRDSFYIDLLFCANILQENIFQSDVFESQANSAEYLRTLRIGWELLPFGDADLLDSIFGGSSGGRLTDGQKTTIQERYNYLESLGPIAWIKGVSGMRRYFGAKFADNLVVLENMDYGNAIYIMFDNWEQLSQLSRTELLQRSNKDFERIKHNGTGWRTKLKMIIDSKLSRN